MPDLRDLPMDAVADKAVGYFAAGHNWAQAVLLAVGKEMGLDCDCIPRIAAGLAGGIGRQGEVCGACTGGVLVIGLLYGPNQPDDKEAKSDVQSKAGEFVQRFAEVNGAIRCRDLIGMDVTSEEAVRRYYAMNLQEECNGFVSNAVRSALELKHDWESS